MMDELELKDEWSEVRASVETMAKLAKKPSTIEALQRVAKIHARDDHSPGLKHIMFTLLALPMSSVDCERGFSIMKLVKTRLRNCLKQETLTNVMRVAIEGPPLAEFEFDRAMKMFNSMKNRRVSRI